MKLIHSSPTQHFNTFGNRARPCRWINLVHRGKINPFLVWNTELHLNRQLNGSPCQQEWPFGKCNHWCSLDRPLWRLVVTRHRRLSLSEQINVHQRVWKAGNGTDMVTGLVTSDDLDYKLQWFHTSKLWLVCPYWHIGDKLRIKVEARKKIKKQDPLRHSSSFLSHSCSCARVSHDASPNSPNTFMESCLPLLFFSSGPY